MYTPSRSIERWQTPVFVPHSTVPLSQGPFYYVYSHYGCNSTDVNHCPTCRYLLQTNTYLHSNSQSFFAATNHGSSPTLERQLSPTPIKPIKYRIDDENDLYILPKVSGPPEANQQAEDAAIVNICLKDKSIDRIVLIDADEDNKLADDDVLYVRVYDVEERSCA